MRQTLIGRQAGAAGRLWRRLSQPHYAIVLVAALSAGVLAADRAMELRQSYAEAERQAAAIASNLALALARDIDSDLSAIDNTLATLAVNLPVETGFRTPGDQRVLDRLKRRLSALSADIRGIYVLDEEGRFAHNTESPALLGADRSDRDYFRGSRDTKGLFIGTPIRSRTTDDLVLSLTRRIEDEEGRFAGVVSAALPLARLEQFYARFDLDESVAISLWRTDGMLMARRPPAPELVGRPIPARRIQAAIEDGARRGVAKDVSPIDGKVRLATFQVLDRYPFAVTIAVEEDAYLADWRKKRQRAWRDLVGFAAGLLGVAAGLAVLFRRRSQERVAAERKLREAMEELNASNHAKTMFLANMSHELRTPLNAIIGFSEMIRDEKWGSVGSPRYREYASHIYGSGEHLLLVINDILDMTRIETGKWNLCYETLDVVREVREALSLVQPLAAEGGLTVSEESAADLPVLQADRRALRQVLLNLLTNAVKFTPKGGTLKTSVRATGGEIVIAVSDTGIGMAAEHLARIGKPFVRIGDPLTAHVGGSGLGLALSKSLVVMHGGRLTIDSAPGKGTTVEIALPVEPTPLSTTAGASHPIPNAAG